MSAPRHPPRELQVSLDNLVRHRLILEPGVFIQDRLDGEALDVWGPWLRFTTCLLATETVPSRAGPAETFQASPSGVRFLLSDPPQVAG